LVAILIVEQFADGSSAGVSDFVNLVAMAIASYIIIKLEEQYS